MTLGALDRKILDRLQQNGRISNVALAEQIGMSPSPCLRRLKQLEDSGVIKGYTAILDRVAVGQGLLAFVEVKVPQVPGEPIIERFSEAVLREPAIVGCYVTAGQFDFLLKVVTADMLSYGQLAQNVILRLPGVQDTRTTFVLETIKETTAVPITA
ncbi:Lrp/AsnC family transcriptional regulator [Rhizorhabdus dicambivorans]|uniref:Lrp/AsnC family transcriptional regulator n=2 Tax=Rhizorhabdus dicambivorans TaxID=1850238 RepID=A0A2A4FQD8_9SPHN|nr:Lrp/AsnC family transcriptional regulator [Rhizorhabdus dicambivorans]PCE39658.1 Lrp/AsnC family transcriptional regulator [Rhizorhabdus dicambivorans]